MKQKLIKYSKSRDYWNLQEWPNIIKLGSKANAFKVFTNIIKLDQQKSDNKIDNNIFVELDNYKLKIIWSRSVKNYFIETWIWDEQVSTIMFRFKLNKIIRQIDYFIKHIESKREVLEVLKKHYQDKLSSLENKKEN